MSNTRLQANRYEYKYLVEERTALRIREFVEQYLDPDPYTAVTDGEGYLVHSLYLDSPDLLLCRQTRDGEKNRFKLRVRFYDDDADSPVFLEVKRRTYDAIHKDRVPVLRQSLPEILEHFVPWNAYLAEPSDEARDAFSRFCELAARISAQPAAYTSYRRQAYERRDNNSYRVTFDRDLRAGQYTERLTVADRDKWPAAPVPGIVVELKFTDRFPNWMHMLVQLFQLQRISVPKYLECVHMVDRAIAASHEAAPRIIVDQPLKIVSPVSGRPAPSAEPPAKKLP